MLTYEQIQTANERISKVQIKNKDYALVNDRVKAFREICPSGSIETEVIGLGDGVVTMRAMVRDEDGHLLGTGTAQEKESSSFINKTSFIENCETSAVGRALGFAGIGVDGSMASAEEVANAMLNQHKKDSDLIPHGEGMTDERIKKIEAELERTGYPLSKLLDYCRVKGLKELTEAQYISVMNRLEKTPDKK